MLFYAYLLCLRLACLLIMFGVTILLAFLMSTKVPYLVSYV